MEIKNVDDIIAMLAEIDADDSRYLDMRVPYPVTHKCGTAACIGGWVRQHNYGSNQKIDLIDAVVEAGISRGDATDMCYPPYVDGHIVMQKARTCHAIRMLMYYKATGKVDWAFAMEADTYPKKGESFSPLAGIV